MLENWFLGFILTGFWVLVGIMAFMLHRNSQERKRQKQQDAERALAQELEEFRNHHAEVAPPNAPPNGEAEIPAADQHRNES